MTKSFIEYRDGNGSGRTFRAVCLLVLVVYSLLVTSSLLNGTLAINIPFNVKHKEGNSKKNIIMMVTDGMGPASLSLARSFKQHTENLAIDDILALDRYLLGSSRTRSSNSLITDSAAGATAFSCALKLYNGAIGVGPDHKPCGTVLEALKLQGYMTGLVVTTRITDATPAAFASHVDYRWQEDLIAQHLMGESPLGRVVDLMIGGGRRHFLPPGRGGSRADLRNLIEEYNEWSYVGTREDFDQLDGGLNVSLPLLALVADGDIPYDIDRDPKQYPSLAEQVKTALTALSEATENSDQGFFLLIEGSRIDHAGHHNDPAAQVREVLAYDEAFKQVLQFIDDTDVETVAISTSDHETGGLLTARQVTPQYPDYVWYPEVLNRSKHSGEYLTRKILTYKQKLDFSEKESNRKFKDFLDDVFSNDMGISVSDEETELVRNTDNTETLLYVLNNMISFRSQTGWSTHGHLAVDVNIYGYTNSKTINERLLSHKQNYGLLGNHENIEIGQFMADLANVDLDDITKRIRHIKHKPDRFTATEDTYHYVNPS